MRWKNITSVKCKNIKGLLPGWDDPPITFIVDLLTDLLNLAILMSESRFWNNCWSKYFQNSVVPIRCQLERLSCEMRVLLQTGFTCFSTIHTSILCPMYCKILILGINLQTQTHNTGRWSGKIIDNEFEFRSEPPWLLWHFHIHCVVHICQRTICGSVRRLMLWHDYNIILFSIVNSLHCLEIVHGLIQIKINFN